MIYKSAIEPLSLESIVQNYQLLGDTDPEVRQNANFYLYSLVDRE